MPQVSSLSWFNLIYLYLLIYFILFFLLMFINPNSITSINYTFKKKIYFSFLVW